MSDKEKKSFFRKYRAALIILALLAWSVYKAGSDQRRVDNAKKELYQLTTTENERLIDAFKKEAEENSKKKEQTINELQQVISSEGKN